MANFLFFFLILIVLLATTISIHKSEKYKVSFHEMSDKILESITYIKSVSRKRQNLWQNLTHRCKSDDGKGTWAPESLDEMLNSMISENVIKLVDGVLLIKPN